MSGGLDRQVYDHMNRTVHLYRCGTKDNLDSALVKLDECKKLYLTIKSLFTTTTWTTES